MWYCEVKGCSGYVRETKLPTGGRLFECPGCGARYGNTRKLKKFGLERWELEEEESCKGCGGTEDHAIECPLIKRRAAWDEFHKRWGPKD